LPRKEKDKGLLPGLKECGIKDLKKNGNYGETKN